MIIKALKNLIVSDGSVTEDFTISHAENILTLEITGEGSFNVQVLGRMENENSFLPSAAIKLSNYSVVETITETGLYMIDTVALSKVRISLVGATQEVTISCRTFDDSK